jgi:glycosyltransferase involved in cell wall biosynthesis
MVLHGCHVQVWTTGLSEGRMQQTSDGRVLVGLGQPIVPATLWRFAPLWRFGHAVRRLWHCSAVDAIFCPDPVLARACLLARPRVPLLYCPGGTIRGSFRWNFPTEAAKGVRQKLKSLFTPGHQVLWAERATLARAAGIIAVSQRVSEQMAEIRSSSRKRTRVIYSGGDFEIETDDATRLPPPLENGLTALTVARLEAIKNIEHLLRAWALVRWQPRRLWIVGEGRELPRLRELSHHLGLSDSIVFLGQRLSVRKWVEAADVFVLPSLYEACPLALLEAMTAGKPSLTLASLAGVSDVAASDEINVDGVTGFVVDPQDPAPLAARLDLLAADASLRRRLGRSAAARARGHFTWARAARAYLAFAHELLRRPENQNTAEVEWGLGHA